MVCSRYPLWRKRKQSISIPGLLGKQESGFIPNVACVLLFATDRVKLPNNYKQREPWIDSDVARYCRKILMGLTESGILEYRHRTDILKDQKGHFVCREVQQED
jgi:hypothetical protein